MLPILSRLVAVGVLVIFLKSSLIRLLYSLSAFITKACSLLAYFITCISNGSCNWLPILLRLAPVGLFNKELPKSSLVIVLFFALVTKAYHLPFSLMVLIPVGALNAPILPRFSAVGTLLKLLVKLKRVMVLLSEFTVSAYHLPC